MVISYKFYDNLTCKRKEKKKSGFETEILIKFRFEVKAQTLRRESKSIENKNLTINKLLKKWG